MAKQIFVRGCRIHPAVDCRAEQDVLPEISGLRGRPCLRRRALMRREAPLSVCLGRGPVPAPGWAELPRDRWD